MKPLISQLVLRSKNLDYIFEVGAKFRKKDFLENVNADTFEIEFPLSVSGTNSSRKKQKIT